jgi:hypothetical protein
LRFAARRRRTRNLVPDGRQHGSSPGGADRSLQRGRKARDTNVGVGRATKLASRYWPRSPHPRPCRALYGDPPGPGTPRQPFARGYRVPAPRRCSRVSISRPPRPRPFPRRGTREDLDEACEIAVRGPMRLFLADIHLHRARLFGLMPSRPAVYPWTSPRDDLDAAKKLIDECGYGRRRAELADAEAAYQRLSAAG